MKRWTLVVVAGQLACSGDATPVGSDFLPVQVGNRWTYREIPKPPCGDPTDEQVDVKEITGTEEYEGRQTFVMVSTPTVSTVVKRFNWSVDDGDVRRLRAEDWQADVLVQGHTYSPGFLRHNARLRQPGDSIIETFTTESCTTSTGVCTSYAQTFTWVVEATGQSMTVPAGTFSCLVLRRERTPGDYKRYWYAEGVGKVYEWGACNDEELDEYALAE